MLPLALRKTNDPVNVDALVSCGHPRQCSLTTCVWRCWPCSFKPAVCGPTSATCARLTSSRQKTECVASRCSAPAIATRRSPGPTFPMKMASASGASTRGPLRRLPRRRRLGDPIAIVDSIRVVPQSVDNRMGAVHAGTNVKSGARHEAVATKLARRLTIARTTSA